MTYKNEHPDNIVLDEIPESVIDAVASALGDASDCHRQWSAWHCGTMTERDFSMVANDGERVAEISRAAITAFLATQAPMINFESWWNSVNADDFRTLNPDMDGRIVRPVWNAALNAAIAHYGIAMNAMRAAQPTVKDSLPVAPADPLAELTAMSQELGVGYGQDGGVLSELDWCIKYARATPRTIAAMHAAKVALTALTPPADAGSQRAQQAFDTMMDVQLPKIMRKGHGHVTPNADGSRARCGGPNLCKVCQQERAAIDAKDRP